MFSLFGTYSVSVKGGLLSAYTSFFKSLHTQYVQQIFVFLSLTTISTISSTLVHPDPVYPVYPVHLSFNLCIHSISSRYSVYSVCLLYTLYSLYPVYPVHQYFQFIQYIQYTFGPLYSLSVCVFSECLIIEQQVIIDSLSMRKTEVQLYTHVQVAHNHTITQSHNCILV